MPDDEGLREAIARAMRQVAASEVADAALFLVEQHGRNCAVEARREAADEFEAMASPTLHGDPFIRASDWAARILRDRADALAADGEPHPAHRHDETEAGRA